MAAALFLGIRDAKATIEPFQEMWSQANEDQVVPTADEREDLLVKLFGLKLLQTPGMRADRAITVIHEAWNLDMGLMRADLVNSVTRAAHEYPWPSVAVAESLEMQAGKLLSARLPQ